MISKYTSEFCSILCYEDFSRMGKKQKNKKLRAVDTLLWSF